MRGWWRPFALYGGVGLAVLAWKTSEEGPPDFIGLVAILLSLAALVGFLVWWSAHRPALFLRGLREAGVEAEVVEDEMTWLGERRMVARTSQGDWRLWSTGGKVPQLQARGPAMPRRITVKGNARQAGRAAGAAGALAKEHREGPFG